MITILPSSTIGKSRELLDWCRIHGVDGNEVYKIEVDGEWATFYRYLPSSRQPLRFRMDAKTGQLLRDTPFVVRMRTPLPTEEQVLDLHTQKVLRWA